MDDAPTKFCKDCKFGKDISPSYHSVLWGCMAPGIGRIDPVDGKQLYRRCNTERADLNGACGPKGKLHEPDDA